MARLNLEKLKPMLARMKHNPADVVALDLASSGTKAVRLRLVDKQPTVVAVDLLPAVSVPHSGQEAVEIFPLEISADLAARYAAIAVPGRNAVVKLLAFPAQAASEEDIESKVVEGLGIEKPEQYRIGYKLLHDSHVKTESRALVVAVPEIEVAYAPKVIPAGLPVPCSLELSGFASMTAFLHGPARGHAEDAVGMIEFGSHISYFAIFNRLVPVLIRKFDFGSRLIMEKVQQSLGIDIATAEGILTDGSFDISQQISEVLDGFIKQIVVSRDFVERREGCRISKVFASGGVTRSRDWLLEIKAALGYDADLWNPFDCVKVADGAIPEQLKGQEMRFTAAIGAGLSVLVPDVE